MLLLIVLACTTPAETVQVTLADGTYYAVVPAGWDGVTALPAAIHFHGAGGSPSQYYDDEEVVADFSAAEVLLLLPEGLDGFFRSDPALFPGDRDDLAFTEAIWADAGERWPIDPTHSYATGFSVGASMIAALGCEYGERYAALAPISGGFWYPPPERCEGPPVPISHTHGTADDTWPLDGRCFGYSLDGSCAYGQASMDDNFALWEDQHRCGEATTASTDGPLSCETWTDCQGGELRLCLHDQGHTRLDGWSARQLDWLLRFSK